MVRRVQHKGTPRRAALRQALARKAIAFQERSLQVLATSYCNRGLTYTGVQAGPGSIAVDPRVIPLGSKLYVPGYGFGTADDTGRLIKGNRIDVWLPTCGASITWGAQNLTVEVIGAGAPGIVLSARAEQRNRSL